MSSSQANPFKSEYYYHLPPCHERRYSGAVIHGLRIIEGDNGLFVSMPSKKNADGTFKDIVHPINRQTREMIEYSVLVEYQQLIGKSGGSVAK